MLRKRTQSSLFRTPPSRASHPQSPRARQLAFTISGLLKKSDKQLDVWDPITQVGALKAVNIIEGHNDVIGPEYLIQFLFTLTNTSGLQPVLDFLAAQSDVVGVVASELNRK